MTTTGKKSQPKRATQKKRISGPRKTTGIFKKPWKVILSLLLLLLLFSPFYYGYVLKTTLAAWSWVRGIKGNTHYHVYKNFNIRIPDKYPIHGIDVSSYQGWINWQKVKKMHQDSIHISFAFIKATEGVLIADPLFQRNWVECKKAGITRGAYHYFRPRFSGKWQAKFFLQNFKSLKGDLPVVVDVEELDRQPPEKMRTELTAFLDEVTLKTKVKPIIYSGLKFYEDNLAGYYSGYNLWLSNFNHPELAVIPATNWKFWQHSDKAKVNGIPHTVDFDAFRGDSLQFRQLLIQ